VFVPFEVVESLRERPNKKWAVQFLFSAKIASCSLSNIRKNARRCSHFPRSGCPTNLKTSAFAGIFGKVSGWESFADSQHNVRLWLGTHNITECAVIERRLRESLLPCCKAKNHSMRRRHIDAANLCPVRGRLPEPPLNVIVGCLSAGM